jgi:hypothetical protein
VSNTAPANIQAPKQSLLQITDTLLQMFYMLETAEQEADRQVIRDEIDRVTSTELAQKVDGIPVFDRRCDLDISEREGLIAEIEASIAQIKERKAFVRRIVRRCMQDLGAVSLRGNIRNIGLQDGKYSLVVENVEQLPQHLKKVQATMAGDVWENNRDNLPAVFFVPQVVRVEWSANNAAVKEALLEHANVTPKPPVVTAPDIPGACLVKGDDSVVMRSNTRAR